MDEHPALALREKKDASILVATDLVRRGEADAVVTAGHTGAGMAAGGPRAGPPAGRRPPGARRPDDHRLGADGPARHRRQPRLDPENLAQYARMGAIFAERVLGVGEPASRCCRSARRRARATPGSARATELLDESGLNFEGNVEGKDLTAPRGGRRRLRRGPRQRGHQVLRGPVDLHLRPVADEFEGSLRGRLAYLLMRPGSAGSDGLRLREGRAARRCSVRGTVIITHGRAKRRMIAFACDVAATTADRVARAHRRDAPGQGPTAPARRRAGRDRRGRHPDGPELTVGPGVVAELVRLQPSRSPASPAWPRGGPARRLVGASAVSCGSATTGSSSGCGSWPGPASPSRSLTDGPRDRRGDRRAAARARAGGRDRHGRWRRRLIARAAGAAGAWSRAIFEADFGQRTAEAILERHLAESERDPTAAALARELVDAVVAHRDAIDAEIGRGAPIPGHRPRQDGPRAAPIGPR